MLAMGSSIKDLGIDQLGVAERLRLIGEIWDSIAADGDAVPVSDAHRLEIQRRVATFAADGNRGRPAEEVIADIKHRL